MNMSASLPCGCPDSIHIPRDKSQQVDKGQRLLMAAGLAARIAIMATIESRYIAENCIPTNQSKEEKRVIGGQLLTFEDKARVQTYAEEMLDVFPSGDTSQARWQQLILLSRRAFNESPEDFRQKVKTRLKSEEEAQLWQPPHFEG